MDTQTPARRNLPARAQIKAQNETAALELWGKTTVPPVPWHVTGIYRPLPVSRLPSEDQQKNRLQFQSAWSVSYTFWRETSQELSSYGLHIKFGP